MIVKEIFYSLQGEGHHAGRPAVFCRFAGCNLWSGRETDRKKATCQFCDTEFRGGTHYQEQELINAIVSCWLEKPELADCANSKHAGGRAFVVLTGGEPALQITSSFISNLCKAGFSVAVETNGTIPLPEGVYWITVSPKHGSDLKVTKGHELKVVWPQSFDLEDLEKLDFRYFYLQPMDGNPEATQLTLNQVLARPKWWLSLQTHKQLGIR